MNKIFNKGLLLVLFFLFLIPLWWMLIGSFMDIFGVMSMPPSFYPRNPTIRNYAYLLDKTVLRWITNTGIVVFCTTAASVLLSSITGYVFAFGKFKGKNIIWGLLLSALFFPRISLIIPQFVLLSKLRISGSLLAVILPCIYAPASMYLARNFFQTIPLSIIESAQLDGASNFAIISKIVIPVSRPLVAALSVFASVGSLQDYIWQMLVLQSENKQTLLVGIMRKVMLRGGAADLGVNPLGRAFAAGMILFIPVFLIFLVASKYFITALEGATKD